MKHVKINKTAKPTLRYNLLHHKIIGHHVLTVNHTFKTDNSKYNGRFVYVQAVVQNYKLQRPLHIITIQIVKSNLSISYFNRIQNVIHKLKIVKKYL